MKKIYSIVNDEIRVHDLTHFSPERILECGQIFRYEKVGKNYEIIANNSKCTLINGDNCVIIKGNEIERFVDYFDLDRDYEELCERIVDKFSLSREVEFGKGLRLLRQDPFEMLISFIVSANNHIPRIRAILSRIASRYGKNMGDFYAFPTPEELSGATEEELYELGLGYRAPYIVKTVKKVLDMGGSEGLRSLSDDELRRSLTSFMGVGGKVADCIMLFGYSRYGVFPVDTWIVQAYGRKKSEGEKLRAELCRKYGDLSGFVQQYVFFYKRSNPDQDVYF